MLGVFETHLDVTDLDRSLEFYTAILGLELALRGQVDGARSDAHSRGARGFALLWVGGRGHAMLGLWERPSEHIHPQHFAFEVGLQELPAMVAELTRQGIELRDFFQQRTAIPTVFGFIPAASIYFDDPDGHVLELLARIPASPRGDLGAVSWAEWTNAVEGAVVER
jgi:catechol 2,3-dioxygenase-like lactoylglutathione lyase family enzyme